MVPESPQEQTVAFGIDLVDPGYRELLDDPDSPQYVDLAHHLQEQVRGSGEPRWSPLWSEPADASLVHVAALSRCQRSLEHMAARSGEGQITQRPLCLPSFPPQDRRKES